METNQPVRTPPGHGTTTAVAPALSIEDQLATLEERLKHLQSQVRQAQQLASLGTAAMTIAHETRNLLTPMLAYAQAVIDSGDTALLKKALTVMLKNGAILITLSERVLTIGAAKPPKRERVRLRPVVDAAVASLCRDLDKDSIRLLIDMDDSITVWADELQVQQVLFNLFLNAREAMAKEHGGRLKVEAHRIGERVQITVQNTGKVIPSELLPHIFQPLQTSKASGTNGSFHCSGLGLALCRDLVEENDGTISVTSTPASGTTFTIILPDIQPAKS